MLLVLLFECLVFGVVGDNFLTTSNAFEITRLSVEVGLLALALYLVNALREGIPPEKQQQLAETMRLIAKSGDGGEFVKRLIEKHAGDGEK